MIFIGYGASAQTPGYMGKRIFATANFGGMLIIPSQTERPNHNFGYDFPHFSIKYVFDLDYVVNRRGSVGFTGSLIQTGMEFTYDAYSTEKNNPSKQYYPYDEAGIKGFSYGVSYKFFHRNTFGSLAPVGNYSKLDLSILSYNVTPHSSILSVNQYNTDSTQHFITPVLTYTFGKQRVLFDNIIFNMGVQFGFVPDVALSLLKELRETESPPERDRIKVTAEKRLFSYYLIHFTVGIGFLIPYRQI